MTSQYSRIRYCSGSLSLINHVTFWGGLNDLAGGDQLEMVGAGELNCFWKWPRSGQPIYTTASTFRPSLGSSTLVSSPPPRPHTVTPSRVLHQVCRISDKLNGSAVFTGITGIVGSCHFRDFWSNCTIGCLRGRLCVQVRSFGS